jgi:hypothetical protein
MNERTLFIHAGGSKTGSSALQNFFEINTLNLEEQGYAYQNRRNIKSGYEINSGNGVLLLNVLSSATTTDDDIDRVVLSYFSECNHAICSSESLQHVTALGWRKLLISINRLGVKLKVVFYIRNVIPFLVSWYDQLIKRHGESRLFDKWAVEATWDHVNALRVMSDELPKESLYVFNYDREKTRLISSFLNFIGVDGSFEINQDDRDRQVNRSLTNQERNVLIAFNKVLGDALSQQLSDFFVSENPDLSAETVSYSKATTQFLIDQYKDEVHWVNNAFFSGQSLVSVLPVESIEKISREKSEINPEGNCAIKKQILDWSFEKILTYQVESEIRLLKKINNLIVFARKHIGTSMPSVPLDFDAFAYLLINRDVFYAGMDPVDHYVNYGSSEGRLYNFSKEKFSLLHRFNNVPDWLINNSLNNNTYLSGGMKKKVLDKNLTSNYLDISDFGKRDLDWSLEQLKIIKERSDQHLSLFLNALCNAAQQYLGKSDPALPADFDLFAYLVLNPEVLYADVDPIQYYCDYGKKERQEFSFIKQQRLLSRLWHFLIRRIKVKYHS